MFTILNVAAQLWLEKLEMDVQSKFQILRQNLRLIDILALTNNNRGKSSKCYNCSQCDSEQLKVQKNLCWMGSRRLSHAHKELRLSISPDVKLQELSRAVLPYLAYNQDVASSYFYLFGPLRRPKWKKIGQQRGSEGSSASGSTKETLY